MSGKTHIAAANATSLAVATIVLKNYNLNLETLPVLIAFSTAGGLIADIDHAGSTLGKKTKVFAMIFSHRGFTHTLWFMAMVCFVLSLFVSVYPLIFFGLGMLSHLICDILTPAGLKPFKLFSDRFASHLVIPIVRNALIEKVFYFGFIAISIFLVYSYGISWYHL